jgi:hypothetical protein
MSTYELLGIKVGSAPDIEVVSTDDKVVEWITEQIKKMSPNVEIFTESTNLPQVKNLRRKFNKMNYEQNSIGLWLIQQLCRDGWEPFGNIGFNTFRGFDFVTLRKVGEKST